MAQQLRERIDKWDYMKLKCFCITKEMVSKLKRLPTEWEKIVCHRINNQYIQGAQNTELPPKINDPMKKWANELNRAFSKEEVQMVKKHIKKFLFNCKILAVAESFKVTRHEALRKFHT
jgi:hypothetical protein